MNFFCQLIRPQNEYALSVKVCNVRFLIELFLRQGLAAYNAIAGVRASVLSAPTVASSYLSSALELCDLVADATLRSNVSVTIFEQPAVAANFRSVP